MLVCCTCHKKIENDLYAVLELKLTPKLVSQPVTMGGLYCCIECQSRIFESVTLNEVIINDKRYLQSLNGGSTLATGN
jgi:hypothetical protein